MAAEDAGELLYLNAELLEARDLGKNGLQLCRSIGCRLSPASECCGDDKETAKYPPTLPEHVGPILTAVDLPALALQRLERKIRDGGRRT